MQGEMSKELPSLRISHIKSKHTPKFLARFIYTFSPFSHTRMQGKREEKSRREMGRVPLNPPTQQTAR